MKKLSIICSVILFFPGLLQAQSWAKGLGKADKAVKAVKSAKIGVQVPKTVKGSIIKPVVSQQAATLPHLKISETDFLNRRLIKERVNFTPLSTEDLYTVVGKQVLSQKDARQVQTQVLFGKLPPETNELLFLKGIPLLSLKHNFALLPSIQQKAVSVYRQRLREYKGSASFKTEADLDDWGKTMAAVSNLGFWGTEQDAKALIDVYREAPDEAKQVTALTVMRSLLCLQATDSAALFAQIAAQDGALTEEFALGIENNTEALATPSSEMLDKMYQAMTHYQPFNALHFNPSAEATAEWLSYKKDIERAEPTLDLEDFLEWQQEQLRHVSPAKLQQMLSGEDNIVFEGLEPASVNNLIPMAKREWVRRFMLENRDLIDGFTAQELLPWADYTRYADPAQELQTFLRNQKSEKMAVLSQKKEEFTTLLNDYPAILQSDFDNAFAEFKQLQIEFPRYNWDNLAQRFKKIAQEPLPTTEGHRAFIKKEEERKAMRLDIRQRIANSTTQIKLRDEYNGRYFEYAGQYENYLREIDRAVNDLAEPFPPKGDALDAQILAKRERLDQMAEFLWQRIEKAKAEREAAAQRRAAKEAQRAAEEAAAAQHLL